MAPTLSAQRRRRRSRRADGSIKPGILRREQLLLDVVHAAIASSAADGHAPAVATHRARLVMLIIMSSSSMGVSTSD